MIKITWGKVKQKDIKVHKLVEVNHKWQEYSTSFPSCADKKANKWLNTAWNRDVVSVNTPYRLKPSREYRSSWRSLIYRTSLTLICPLEISFMTWAVPSRRHTVHQITAEYSVPAVHSIKSIMHHFHIGCTKRWTTTQLHKSEAKGFVAPSVDWLQFSPPSCSEIGHGSGYKIKHVK